MRDGAARRRPAPSACHFVEATRLATALLGDAIFTNPFLLGYALQLGRLPVAPRRARARDRAERPRGRGQPARARVGTPRRARSRRGRCARRGRPARAAAPAADTLEALVERRAAFLTDYQDAAYAARYRALVARVAARERAVTRRGRAARARGRAQLREAAGGQGRVRGRAALHRRRVPPPARERVRGRLPAGAAPGAAAPARDRLALRPPRGGQRAHQEDRLRQLDLLPSCACWRASSSCAARPSTPSAASRTGASSAGSRATTRRASRSCARASSPDNLDVAVEIARLPEHVRGFESVKEQAPRGGARPSRRSCSPPSA